MSFMMSSGSSSPMERRIVVSRTSISARWASVKGPNIVLAG